MNLFAQSTLGPKAAAVTHDEHPQDQLWINRWAAQLA